jgi:hypothetical protein
MAVVQVDGVGLTVTLMEASYDSKCQHCWQPISRGTMFQWVRATRQAFHSTCEVEAVPQPRPDPVKPFEGGPVRMTARFDGKCRHCGGRIRAGEQILYAKPNAFHAACEPTVVATLADSLALDLTVLPFGTCRFAVDDLVQEKLRFIRVDNIAPKDADGRPQKWGGNVYVKEQFGPSESVRLGRQVAGRKYEGEASVLLAAILLDPEKAAIRYGIELGCCSICGAELTNVESRALGIGPVCRKRFSWGDRKPVFAIADDVELGATA